MYETMKINKMKTENDNSAQIQSLKLDIVRLDEEMKKLQDNLDKSTKQNKQFQMERDKMKQRINKLKN